MNEQVLNIKTITPMLSHGVNKDAEIRIPEFKSAMRFWWRALGKFENIEEMRKEEGQIFGDSMNINDVYHASPIGMRFIHKSEIIKDSFPIYLRKNKEVWSRGICPNKNFQISINKRLNKGKELDYYVNLLELVSIIGGIGQKSRKGYGCFYIENKAPKKVEDRRDVFNYLKDKMEKLEVNNYYKFNESQFSINRINYGDIQQRYPYIIGICIGRKCCSRKDFFKRIKKATDTVANNDIKYKKDDSRLACPLYVTCFSTNNESVFPIICFLNNIKYYEDYKKYIGIFRSEVLCQEKS